jgi:thioesterase domain-containing protein
MPLARFVPEDTPLYGLQAPGLDGGDELMGSVREMAACYVERIRALQPAGPYHLMGFSFGGIAAHEMAVQLAEAGETVAALVIMDTYPVPEEEAQAQAEGGAQAQAQAQAQQELEQARPRQDPDAELEEWTGRFRAENGALLGGMSEEELRRGVRVGRNNVSIRRGHRPGVFAGDVLLFVAEDSGARGSGSHLWASYVAGRITEVHVACTHSNMVEPGMLGRIWTSVEAWRTARD